MTNTLVQWSEQCQHWVREHMQQDSAHDMAHLQRVVTNAQRLARAEQADITVVTLAAWLHDLVNYPKDHPKRAQSARDSAQAAREYLAQWGADRALINAVSHAIEAHSYSGGMTPTTIEACVVQDADRLDALGALGVARCCLVGGRLDRTFYDHDDPFCEHRTPNDQAFTLDHFYQKLLHLAADFNTESGRLEAQQRSQFMQAFLAQLRHEISPEIV